MASSSPPPPAFGQATLSNCEREPIHLAGSIQPHGALLSIREPDGLIVQTSANAAAFLGMSDDPCGLPLAAIGGDIGQRIIDSLAGLSSQIPACIACTAGPSSANFTALVHRAAGGELIVELERNAASEATPAKIEAPIAQLINASTLQTLCDSAAQEFHKLTGYDRVMIYRFDHEGHGEVFAESKKPELEAFLGNRYPASDIPQIARRLYGWNRVRVLGDVHAEQALLTPRLSPVTNKELDMSLCFLRSVSPIHLQYLENMGVSATLVVSLMVGGRLWGLISCHHYQPRLLPFDHRSVCEVLAEVIATRIAALEGFAQGRGELAARRLEQRMAESVAERGDWRSALFDRSRPLLLPLAATGAALILDNEVTTAGDVPGTDEIRELAQWAASRVDRGHYATAGLGAAEPRFAPLATVASGILVAPISDQDDEALIWFRSERVRTVTWGGDPSKTISSDDDPSELSPRRSFAQWHQVVKGTSDPWTPADLRAAHLIAASVSDVAIQIRAVRILIIRDQLQQVQRQVRASGQQVLVADARGAIVEANADFMKWLGVSPSSLKALSELPSFFGDESDARRRLQALMHAMRPWHGEALVNTRDGRSTPVLVRADPVFDSSERTLGYVLVFIDLTERKVAETARRRFQENIIRSKRAFLSVEAGGDLSFRKLMSSVIENAQLAALEITDGPEISEVPILLESVGASVTRTAEALHFLSRSGGRRGPRGGG